MKINYTIILLFMFIACTNKAAKEKFRIPYAFKGQVFIFFNIKDGEKKKYENGYRIYDIPTNGILKTQFKPNYGYQKKGECIYVYVDSLNHEIPLQTHERDYQVISNSEVYITAEESGGVGNRIEYRTYNVKTKNQEIILANRNFEMMDSVLKKAGVK